MREEKRKRRQIISCRAAKERRINVKFIKKAKKEWAGQNYPKSKEMGTDLFSVN
jgi:hypothetical protein